MLKLYRMTIVVSEILSVLLLIVAYNVNSDAAGVTYAFIQNCLIGIACSLVVVIITTCLQFISEHKKVFYEYKRSLRKLYFNALYIKDSDINNFSASRLNEYRDVIDQCLEELKKCIENLCWFCPVKNKRYNKSFMTIYRIMIDFYKDEHSSPQKALKRLGEDSVIEMLEKLINECATDKVDKFFVDNMFK